MIIKQIEGLQRHSRGHALIYCLYDKTSQQVGYVGLSTKPRSRWTSHQKEINAYCLPSTLDTIYRDKVSWAQWRLNNNGVLTMKALETVSVKWLFHTVEKNWTEYFVLAGHPICNHRPMTDEWEAIILNNWSIFHTERTTHDHLPH